MLTCYAAEYGVDLIRGEVLDGGGQLWQDLHFYFTVVYRHLAEGIIQANNLHNGAFKQKKRWSHFVIILCRQDYFLKQTLCCKQSNLSKRRWPTIC